MSQQDSHQRGDSPAPSNASAGEFRKLLPTAILAVITAFATSWWNTQIVQNNFQHRIDRLKDKSEENARNIATNADLLQKTMIRIAEIGEGQKNMLEQVRDLKAEQNAIKTRLK